LRKRGREESEEGREREERKKVGKREELGKWIKRICCGFGVMKIEEKRCGPEIL
jgi:hypothetical protein